MTTLTGLPAGRFPAIDVQVSPKSVVLWMDTRSSSRRQPVLVTKAVPAACGDGRTRVTQKLAGPPAAASLAVRSSQVAPPSFVTWTLPSSDPVQMTPGVTGDSARVVSVQ